MPENHGEHTLPCFLNEKKESTFGFYVDRRLSSGKQLSFVTNTFHDTRRRTTICTDNVKDPLHMDILKGD